MRSKWHQMLLSSLQLAKVMAIPKFKIWVLQNFCSKNFRISKFCVCNFLTITKMHFLLEHIKTLKPSLHMIFGKSVFFKIWNYKFLFNKFPKFQNSKFWVWSHMENSKRTNAQNDTNCSIIAFIKPKLWVFLTFLKSFWHFYSRNFKIS
jgi:hypothetical protein